MCCGASASRGSCLRSSPCSPDYRVRDAVALLHEHRVSQLPVVSAEDETTVVGAVGEQACCATRPPDPALLEAEISEVMEPPFPAVVGGGPRPRGGRAAGRRPAGAARDRGRAGRRRRDADGPARGARLVSGCAVRDAFATRAVHAGLDAGPVVRLDDPRDPPDLDLRSAAARRVLRATTTTRARPTRRAAALERALGELEGGSRRRLRAPVWRPSTP